LKSKKRGRCHSINKWNCNSPYLDPGSAQHAVDSVITMLSRQGVLSEAAARPEMLCGEPRVVSDDDLLTIRTPCFSS